MKPTMCHAEMPRLKTYMALAISCSMFTPRVVISYAMAPRPTVLLSGGLSFKNLIVLRHCSYVGWVDHAPRPSKEGPTPDHASGGGVLGKDRRNVDVPFGLLSEKRLSSTFAILKNGSELAGNGAMI
jgi:hypothetical protein